MKKKKLFFRTALHFLENGAIMRKEELVEKSTTVANIATAKHEKEEYVMAKKNKPQNK